MFRSALAGCFFVALLVLACGGSPERAPDVLFVSVSSIVPEHTSAYGGDVATPNLDALSKRGVLFRHARTVAPLALPAHASMLTGLTPPRHGLRVNGAARLAQEVETLPERLRAAGFQTAAFVGAATLDEHFGLDQGFDLYVDTETDGELVARHSAATVVDLATAWWTKRDTARPSFLWAQLVDAHGATSADAQKEHVAAVDRQLGRLLDLVGEQAVVVLVGDHGESFGAHGEPTHGAFVYDTTLRVPLVVRFPGAAGGGTKSNAPVSVTDVAPTILAAMGLAPIAALDGMDLAQPLAPERPIYFESYQGFRSFGWSPIAGVLVGDDKLIQAADPELFRLSEDPSEARDLDRAEPERVKALRVHLRTCVEAPAVKPEPVALGAELEAALARLGYPGGGIDPEGEPDPSPLEPHDWPSPHTRARQLQAFDAARQLIARGQATEAMARLREILTDNSRNHSAQALVGTCLMSMSQWQSAIQAFQSATRYRQGPWAAGWLEVATCLENMGASDNALEAYQSSHAIAPLPSAHRERARAILSRAGRADEFTALFGEAR